MLFHYTLRHARWIREMQAERKLTANQKVVLDTLVMMGTPLGAYGLLERVAVHGIRAPLQVYRALDKLIEYGFVHRLESLNAFVVCSHRDAKHHQPAAFAICTKCGQVAEFLETSVGRGLERWSKGHAFKAECVTVEMRGLCGDCAGVPQ
jgi:Fur family zinc uptake transcriptional regulator